MSHSTDAHDEQVALGPALYVARAQNESGATGQSWIDGGLRVDVTSPLGEGSGGATNPEELLALAWATCLNASARIIAGPGVDVHVQTRISLHHRSNGESFEFSGHADISFTGQNLARSDELAQAAHERCPVSRMLSGYSRVTISASNGTGGER